MTTDPVFQFERVYGNMEIIRGSKKGVSAPNLVSVDGYLSIETTMANISRSRNWKLSEVIMYYR